MVLFVRAETGSFARAGAGGGRLRARRRLLGPGPGPAHRPPRPRAGSCCRWPACTRPRWAALVAFGLAGAPTGALVACGLAAGITIPPVGSVVRPLLAGPARRDDASLLPTAYALDGIAIELVFVTGPLLTAAIVVVASPAVALLVACGVRDPRHDRARHVAGLARLAARRAATTSATCSARWPRPACAPSSPRRPPSASPWAPPR